ncbi:MAG: Cell division protein FtsH [uncultured Sulfurovum sp.]|uniref:histidine kinase n=1 Tax=uncultured Sulfurovum sp. TaxID=269237 RepID=A0A6S6T2U7_9BACT|nr:MAG: Cell division protein FtsH [uncultured Sulfurovum sp.]
MNWLSNVVQTSCVSVLKYLHKLLHKKQRLKTMRQLVHYYYHQERLVTWIKEKKIISSTRLLVEINFPDSDQEKLQKLLNLLSKLLPEATILGMQSFTSFVNHRVTDINPQPVISIMEFQSTKLSTEIIDLNRTYDHTPIELTKIEKHLQADTKAVQILSSYNEIGTSSLINQIGQKFNQLKVFGGGASSKKQNENKSFIFHNKIIYNKALILIFMHGENLNVELFQAFDWKPISKKKVITKIKGNAILTLDDSSALDIYKKYFPNIEDDTSVSLQVPLYTTKNNISSTAHILNINFKNESLEMAQALQEGDIVQLSIGNYNAMMNRIQEIHNFLTNTPAQALWIGTCVSYEYGFRIPIIHYISNIKKTDQIFGYSTSKEYFNTENQPNTYHNHTFIMAAITESNSEYIQLSKSTSTNIGPFERANKNLYSIMHKTANELNQLTENLENIVEQRTKELEILNEGLQVKIKDAVRKEKRQNAIMNQQSRLASMGEILENIAHQWRQPLNTVSWIMNDTLIKAQMGRSDEVNLEELAKRVNNSVQFLSDTIENFRRFLDHSDMAQTFNIKKTIEATILLIKETLIKSDISIELHCLDGIKYKGYENDFKQIIMNLINNARDAMEERKIENGHISIRVYHEKDELLIAIQDNAGGIPKPILKNIFEPYFTTKHKSKGTGLGLYMSKNLIEKVKGNIEAISILNKKTTFLITLPDEGAIPTAVPKLTN